MVDVIQKRCSHESCTEQPSFNIEGNKTAAYCKTHATDGMVDVRAKRCSHQSCTTQPSFGVEGSKRAAYCKAHAEDSMVDVLQKRCSHDSCTRRPSFNIKGDKRAAYCKQHADENMIRVGNTRCSHDRCNRLASWGSNVEDAATVCASHKGDISGDHVVYFRAKCPVGGCGKQARWGLNGKQPTHCPQHGSLRAGLVCIVGEASSKAGVQTTSDGEGKSPSICMKTECTF